MKDSQESLKTQQKVTFEPTMALRYKKLPSFKEEGKFITSLQQKWAGSDGSIWWRHIPTTGETTPDSEKPEMPAA